MRKFVSAVKDVDGEVTDSVYVGDRLVQGYSRFSRNHTFGKMIGKGNSIKIAQLEMEMIAEGYYGTKCIHEINEKYKVNKAIIDTLDGIRYEKKSPTAAIQKITETFK